MYKIEKTFIGYPFAHRQPKHQGHCAFIHGHNWDFTVVLESEDNQLDENQFVYDFGKFAWLKEWFTHMFDHTCVINSDDPRLFEFEAMNSSSLIKLRTVPSGSAEGLAKYIFDHIENNLNSTSCRLVSVTVHEDYKNTATYSKT